MSRKNCLCKSEEKSVIRECPLHNHKSKPDRLREIFYSFIVEDDRNRDKVSYDLGKNVTKHVKRIRNLRLKEIL